MFELETILLGALEDAGLRAGRALPEALAGRLTKPVCALSLTELKAPEGAFGQYYGLYEHPTRGPVPLCGRRFTAQLSLGVYAPDSVDDCNAACAKAAQALLDLAGLTVRELGLGRPVWDDEAAAYRRELTLTVSGVLYFPDPEDEGEFTDFTLVPTIL